MIMILQDKRVWLVPASIAVLFLMSWVLGILPGSGLQSSVSNPVNSSQVVEMIDLNQVNQARELVAYGQIESSSQANISSETGGVIQRVNVSIGDDVSVGTELVSFGTDEARAQLSQAHAGLEAQKARLAEMEFGERSERIRIQENELERAQNNLAEVRRQAENSITSARQELLNNDLQAYLDDPRAHLSYYNDVTSPTISGTYTGQTEGEYNLELYRSGTQSSYSLRFQGPTGRGVVSVNTQVPQPLGDSGLYIQFPSGFDLNAHLDWVILIPNHRSVGYATLRDRYERAVENKEPAIKEAKNALASSREQLDLLKAGTREEQLAAQRAQVSQAEANVLSAQAQLNKRSIRAPFSGRVGSVQVRQGENINPGQPVISLVNDEILRLKIFLDPAQAREVTLGDHVMVAEKYRGKVSAKAPSLNPETGQVEIQILISEPTQLVVGEYVQARIRADSNDNELWIPLSAVRVNSSGQIVMINESNRAVAKPIETGSVVGDRIRVLSGLESREAIIKDIRQLSPNQTIEVK